MKPKPPKPRKITAFKIKRHSTTVDNVSTSYFLTLFLPFTGIYKEKLCGEEGGKWSVPEEMFLKAHLHLRLLLGFLVRFFSVFDTVTLEDSTLLVRDWGDYLLVRDWGDYLLVRDWGDNLATTAIAGIQLQSQKWQAHVNVTNYGRVFQNSSTIRSIEWDAYKILGSVVRRSDSAIHRIVDVKCLKNCETTDMDDTRSIKNI
jgi:hypothetical protein